MLARRSAQSPNVKHATCFEHRREPHNLLDDFEHRCESHQFAGLMCVERTPDIFADSHKRTEQASLICHRARLRDDRRSFPPAVTSTERTHDQRRTQPHAITATTRARKHVPTCPEPSNPNIDYMKQVRHNDHATNNRSSQHSPDHLLGNVRVERRAKSQRLATKK